MSPTGLAALFPSPGPEGTEMARHTDITADASTG
jgi:hypothetical protein